jgi:hypothetical protein
MSLLRRITAHRMFVLAVAILLTLPQACGR